MSLETLTQPARAEAAWFSGDSQNFERKSPRCDLTIHVLGPDLESMLERHGNLSAGGFFLEEGSDEEFAPGGLLDLQFYLPELNLVISARGEVLEHAIAGDRVGVRGRFVHMAPEDRSALALWLEEQCTTPRRRVGTS